ncbi:tetratricopeptide repeat protein [Streptomyces geranii]|uniref:tetratricopeptide repeat protein n=1 Tax=Streptomyces geranii TaxID=2058923 RepID=UPI000D02E98C|nr:tetratricopeptide repeat protein [Streptomyces geranii]
MATEYGGDHIDLRGANVAGSVTAKAVYREHAPAPSALDALPARAVGFTGREVELRELLDAFDPAKSTDAPEAVLVAAVSGLGGIGKTALAVQAGYEACGKGWFPGGVLFVDLHGYDEEPVTGNLVLEVLLRALGTEPEHIPVGLDARGALYRSALARRAQEQGAVLILADNASSPAQVRPLLPGGAGHRVLVTSRDRLPQLAARLIALDELTPEEACELLDRALRIAHPADRRITDDSEEAAHLAALCGHLPLALQIAAALLVLDPDKPIAELAAELRDSGDRLVHLDDSERSVRAAFHLSYRRLLPEQARLLRLLALAPGPEVTTEVVAVLFGADTAPAHVVNALSRAHLIERGSGRGRWRLHDLVREFGLGVVAADAELRKEGEEARGRVLDFYSKWAGAADARLRWLPGAAEPDRFVDRGQALAWLDGERAGLVAAVQWAGEERYARSAVALAARLHVYLEWRRYFDDLITVERVVQEVAHSVGDHRSEAAAWINLGRAMMAAGRGMEAVDALSRCLGLFPAPEDAIEAITSAHDPHQGREHCREAEALTDLGYTLWQAGRMEEAVDAFTRVLGVLQAAGDRHLEGVAWNNLGSALCQAGRMAEAIEACGKSMEICAEFDDWYGAGVTLENLAFTYEENDCPREASAYYRQAADAYTRANDPTAAADVRAQAEALTL